jgi:1-acyl-sn-glycerol-3-phosphate acyltransferase
MWQWIRSVAFTAVFLLLALLYSPLAIPASIMPFRMRYPVARFWARSELEVLRWMCGLDYRVEGRENIPPTPHVAMWKHSSAWETIAQIVICPPQAWVLKRELLWIPLFGWLIALMRPIAIKRSASTRSINQVVEQGKVRLDAGLPVLVFPEGTRVAQGERRRYGMSGFLLATQTGVPIVPVAHNAGDFWVRRGVLKKRGCIRVIIGPPIPSAGREPRELAAEVREWMEARAAEISRDYRGAGA